MIISMDMPSIGTVTSCGSDLGVQPLMFTLASECGRCMWKIMDGGPPSPVACGAGQACGTPGPTADGDGGGSSACCCPESPGGGGGGGGGDGTGTGGGGGGLRNGGGSHRRRDSLGRPFRDPKQSVKKPCVPGARKWKSKPDQCDEDDGDGDGDGDGPPCCCPDETDGAIPSPTVSDIIRSPGISPEKVIVRPGWTIARGLGLALGRRGGDFLRGPSGPGGAAGGGAGGSGSGDTGSDCDDPGPDDEPLPPDVTPPGPDVTCIVEVPPDGGGGDEIVEPAIEAELFPAPPIGTGAA